MIENEFKLARIINDVANLNSYHTVERKINIKYIWLYELFVLFCETKNKTYGNNILDIKYVYGITIWLFFLTRTKRQEDINITNCSFLFVVYLWNGYVCLNPVLTTK
jgi:hypothetical protein